MSYSTVYHSKNNFLILTLGILLLLLLVSGCKPQEVKSSTPSNISFDLDLLYKDWKYDKLLVNGEEQQMGVCENTRRLKINKNGTYTESYSEEGDCEDAEKGYWEYNKLSNDITIKSESQTIDVHLEILNGSKMQFSFLENDSTIELVLSPVE